MAKVESSFCSLLSAGRASQSSIWGSKVCKACGFFMAKGSTRQLKLWIQAVTFMGVECRSQLKNGQALCFVLKAGG